jgi:hypothetical protein
MEIVSSLQANAYDGVKHSVSQKDTDLRGEALRQPEPFRGRAAPDSNMIGIQSKSLLPSQLKSVLIPHRKEWGHWKTRKVQGVGVQVVQVSGAPLAESKAAE